MIIYSQDRKRVMDCVTLAVSKNYGAKKEEKYAIIGTAGFASGIDGNVFALYPDEKTAIDELEKAYNAFAEGARSYKF